MPCRWGFWKRLTSGKDQQHLLPEGHSPSSPGSQHTLVIQDSIIKPVESSSNSKHFGGSPSSAFASPTAQQQQQQQQQQSLQQRLGLSRLNSEVSRKPGSASVCVRRRSTDVPGAAGSTAAGTGAKPAAPAAGTAAAVTADPLLQSGLLETVNLKMDGKAVSSSVDDGGGAAS